jgi:phosphodiesterase/alkaline phosphatase D-like protein
MKNHKFASPVVVFAAVLAASATFVCSSSFAVVGHVPRLFSPFGSFTHATGIAVDQSSGNVFVADSGANDVRVFDAEGGGPAGGLPAVLTGVQTPAGAFDFLFEGSFPEPVGVAVDSACWQHGLSGAGCTSFDPSNGAIYVTDTEHNVVDKFRVNGSGEYEYVCQFTGFGFVGSACLKNEPTVQANPTQVTFSEPIGVAVDREGNVYIADYGSSAIYEFNAAGEDVGKIPSPPELNPEAGLQPQDIALDAKGDLYVRGFQPSAGVVKLKRSGFTGAGESEQVIVPTHGNPQGMTFNQSAGALFVGFNSFVSEYNEAGEAQGSFGAELVNSPKGMAVNETTGDIYVVNGGGVTVDVFSPLVELPSATTGAATDIEPTSATVEGTVNPESKTLEASCEVQYGTSVAYGQTVACAPEKVGTGNEPVPVTASLAGLLAGTAYHYRVVAVNSNGANPGPDATLTTAPAVQGVVNGEASEIGKTNATLHGSLKPNGIDAHYYFEYGETLSYGSTSPAPPGTDAGKGDVATEEVVPATTVLSGLKANTTYYYRLVASNEFGSAPATEGGSFKTLPNDPVVSSESVAFVESEEALVSAVVNPNEASTTYHFVYGPTASYGSSAPVSELELGSGGEGLTVLLTLTGLQPGTTYHYAVVATNAGGSTYGPDQAFTTAPAALPVVSTGGASEVSQNSAVISGTLDPNGVNAGYEFDIGADTTYGVRVFGDAGSGDAPETFTFTMHGLAAGSTYHYRLVAHNAFGTVYGPDETFTTPGFPTSLISSPLGAPLVPEPVFAPPRVSGVSSGGAPGKTGKHATKKHRTGRRKVRKRAGRASVTAHAGHERGIGR